MRARALSGEAARRVKRGRQPGNWRKKRDCLHSLACEQQTHFRSSLNRERSDDRKCVCCSQASIARPNEICVGLTRQNTIGWCVKRWQRAINNRNHWQVDDGWSTAGMCFTFPEKTNIRYGAKRSIRRSHLSGYVTWSRNLNAQSLSSLSRNALVPKR